MTLSIKEYDKVVRKFVDDYVNNLTPDQLREIVHEQSHIDLKTYVKILDKIQYGKKWRVGIVSYLKVSQKNLI